MPRYAGWKSARLRDDGGVPDVRGVSNGCRGTGRGRNENRVTEMIAGVGLQMGYSFGMGFEYLGLSILGWRGGCDAARRGPNGSPGMPGCGNLRPSRMHSLQDSTTQMEDPPGRVVPAVAT